MIKNILFDFDGVILDSMPVRDKGFEVILSDYPKEQISALLDFHRINGGLSRYVKIRYFFEEIRGEKVLDEEVIRMSEEFSKVMRKELINKNLLIGETLEFIRKASREYSLHIVSGSDQNELRYLCEKLEINSFFVSIGGSPTPKIQLVKDLISNYQLNRDETILIGDSINDYEAAEKNNISFWGFNNQSLKKCSRNYIENYSDLLKDGFE